MALNKDIDTMLRAYAVKKTFTHKGKETVVLQSCSFELKRGTTCALMGKSGSGKSTFMHLLAGFDVPDSGTIFFNEHLVHTFEPQERSKYITFVPQRPFFIRELTVFENIALAGTIVGMSEKRVEENTLQFLAEFDLLSYKDAFIGELSGGQQQRVALARALVVEPECLLADEPTGSLDEDTGMYLIEVLLKCVKKWNMSLVISTHNEAIAHKMEVVFLLKHGILEPVASTVQFQGTSYEHSSVSTW